jgi:ABC-type branched-subunit amino acid transport system ATPase component
MSPGETSPAETAAADVALVVRDLEVGYGRGPSVVEGVSLSVPRGKCVGLVGANGAGKSSILRCIAGLHKPRGGTVELNGRDITGTESWRLARQGLRMVPETRELFGSLSVEMNLHLGAISLASRKREPAVANAREVFPALERLMQRTTSSLSGGEQEMVAVARAVAGAPDVVIMDEPTLGLAPTAIGKLEQGLERLLEAGVTILLSEQNVGLVRALATHVVAVRMGRVVASGTPEELFSESALRHLFLGAEA